MIPRCSPLSLLALMALVLVGCSSADKKKPEISKPPGDLKDQSGDASFQSFASRLRKAVAKRDKVMLASMMTPDFGFSWAEGGEGPEVFNYWDANQLWPELQGVLSEKFVPSGDYMVAPAEVTYNPDYAGYRAGLRLVNGAWRFAYFVPAPPASMQ